MDGKLLRGNIRGEGVLSQPNRILAEVRLGWSHITWVGGGVRSTEWGGGRKGWWRMRNLIRYWGDQGVG